MSNQRTISIDDLEDPEEGAVWRRLPRSYSTRRRLKLTVEQYSERYRIPVPLLRAWEDGTAVPDAVAEALMLAIARDPEGLAKALGLAEPRVRAAGVKQAAE